MVSEPSLVPSNKAVGQVVEWLVWAAVVGHAEQITHVFLPLDDRGVDGIVRRVPDEAMRAVQVKGRAVIEHGHITAVVNRHALDDPHVTIVIAYPTPPRPVSATPSTSWTPTPCSDSIPSARWREPRGGAGVAIPAEA